MELKSELLILTLSYIILKNSQTYIHTARFLKYVWHIAHERINISFATERDSLLLHKKWILRSELK